jgi:hypothetical protein
MVGSSQIRTVRSFSQQTDFEAGVPICPFLTQAVCYSRQIHFTVIFTLEDWVTAVKLLTVPFQQKLDLREVFPKEKYKFKARHPLDYRNLLHR